MRFRISFAAGSALLFFKWLKGWRPGRDSKAFLGSIQRGRRNYQVDFSSRKMHLERLLATLHESKRCRKQLRRRTELTIPDGVAGTILGVSGGTAKGLPTDFLEERLCSYEHFIYSARKTYAKAALNFSGRTTG